MYAMVGISAKAWNAAAAPMRNAPPPRKSICRLRKFCVAASDAPSRKQLTRNPQNPIGILATGRAGGLVEGGSCAVGMSDRHLDLPQSRVCEPQSYEWSRSPTDHTQ